MHEASVYDSRSRYDFTDHFVVWTKEYVVTYTPVRRVNYSAVKHQRHRITLGVMSHSRLLMQNFKRREEGGGDGPLMICTSVRKRCLRDSYIIRHRSWFKNCTRIFLGKVTWS